MWSAYFHMGTYKHDEVVVMKMGAYIHGVHILCGYLLPRFYGNMPAEATHNRSFKCVFVYVRVKKGGGGIYSKETSIYSLHKCRCVVQLRAYA